MNPDLKVLEARARKSPIYKEVKKFQAEFEKQNEVRESKDDETLKKQKDFLSALMKTPNKYKKYHASRAKRVEDRFAEGLGTFVFDGKKDCKDKDKGRSCRWGGPCATPNPVLMSLCIPLKKSSDSWYAWVMDNEFYGLECKYRVCFDARAVLEEFQSPQTTTTKTTKMKRRREDDDLDEPQSKRRRTPDSVPPPRNSGSKFVRNPLLTSEGKPIFSDEEYQEMRKNDRFTIGQESGSIAFVEKDFFEMLKLAVGVHDVRQKMGYMNMEGIDRSFVRNVMARAVSENLDKFYGPTLDKFMGRISLSYDRLKSFFKKFGHMAIIRIPIFAILLPFVTDMVLLVTCAIMNRESVDTLYSVIEAILDTFSNNSAILLLKSIVDMISKCLGAVQSIPMADNFLKDLGKFAKNFGKCLSSTATFSQFDNFVFRTMNLALQVTLSYVVDKMEMTGNTLENNRFYKTLLFNFTKDFRASQELGGMASKYTDGAGNYTLWTQIYSLWKSKMDVRDFSGEKRQLVYKHIGSVGGTNGALSITMLLLTLEHISADILIQLLAIGLIRYFGFMWLLSGTPGVFVNKFITKFSNWLTKLEKIQDFQLEVASFLRFARSFMIGSGLNRDIVILGIRFAIAFYQQVLLCWLKQGGAFRKPILTGKSCCMAQFFKEYKEIVKQQKGSNLFDFGGFFANVQGINPFGSSASSSSTNNLVFGPTKTKTKTIGCVENFKGYCIKMYRVRGTNKVIFRPSVAELQKKVPEAVKTNDKNKTTVILRSKLPSDLRRRLREWNKM